YAASGAITGSAAVRGGVVYAGSQDGALFALDLATGALRWSRSAGSSTASSPAVAGNILYIAVIASRRDGPVEKIQARRRSGGGLLWSYTGGHLLAGGVIEPSPSVANGVVYAPSYDGTVRACAADTGAVLWQYRE